MHEKEVYVTASAGISVFPYDGEDADTLIRNADIAMYHAKINGKSQYCLCTSDMKKESSLKHELSNKLYRAIDNDEFVLYYQPQISLQTNEIVGVESLIRWKQPEHGFISPSIFIPIAEQIGLIRPIGEWVLKTACTQYRIWMDMGCSPIRMSVNVSVLQLRSQDFVTVVSNVIKETGIEPKYLEIEITESAAVKESDYIVKVLEELKELGINITIDDFGMEYSSLNRLNLMPVNRIKIDLHFIRNLLRSDKDQSIINGMIHLSHALGIKVLAEGVEEQYQLEFLREHSCDEVQGYLLHRPLPAEKFIKLLKGRIKDQK